MSNITSWLSVEQLLRAVEDRYQWRLTAHDAANLRAHEDGWRQDKSPTDSWMDSLEESVARSLWQISFCGCSIGLVTCATEQYLQSIEDFTSSLEVLKTTVEDMKTDRTIAETHYHIGVACVYAARYDDGVTHFRDAITILEAKNTALEAVVAASNGKDGSEETAEVTAARSEMKDIAELIPEIKLKVHYFTSSLLLSYLKHHLFQHHHHPYHPDIYFLIFFPFYFSLSFIGFTYFLLLSIPSLSTRIVPLCFQAGKHCWLGHLTRKNPSPIWPIMCLVGR